MNENSLHLQKCNHIAEWSDIHSTDDFEMEENKGGLIFLPLMIRRSNEHYLSSVEGNRTLMTIPFYSVSMEQVGLAWRLFPKGVANT